MQIQPYLYFEGRCEEALSFYRGAIGAKIGLTMRFKDGPPNMPNVSPKLAEKIMHASFTVGDSEVLVADGHCEAPANFKGFTLALRADDEPGAQRLFVALADGGSVRMPLTKTFFSPSFGMLTDRFGVGWIVMVSN